MNINPLNFVRACNNYNVPQNNKVNWILPSDTFVKSSKEVSFKGDEQISKSEKFIQWAQQTDFINQHLEEVLFNPANVIGQGNSNTAILIPNNDDFVLRIGTETLKESLHRPNIKDAKLYEVDYYTDLNVGQKVAEFSVPSKYAIEGETDWLANKIEVLKKQKGEPIGVQAPETLVRGDYNYVQREGLAPYEDYSRKDAYARTIHKVSQLPVSAYEKLISDFTKACELGFGFDHLNSHNLLVDSDSKTINLIDMSTPTKSGSMTPNYADLLYSLTNISYFKTFNDEYYNPVSEEQRHQSLTDTVKIIEKFSQAMKNQGVKFDRNSASTEFCYVFLGSFPNVLYSRTTDFDGFWRKAEKMGIA